MPHPLTAGLVLIALSLPFQAVQPVSPPLAQARAALTALTAGDVAMIEAQFTPEMKAAMPPGRLATTWAALQAQVGKFTRCSDNSRLVPINDKQMVVTACTFERGMIDVQFAFDSEKRISGMALRPAAGAEVPYTAPPYVTPAAFTETAVTIGSGEWALPGTLTMPVGTTRVPAVVLVHGSGPADRDTTVGPNKPFRDLAGGLASRGVAVLRYDKRTLVHRAKMGKSLSFTVREETIDDALLAVQQLRSDPRVDPSRIYVAGHSLGGMLIPRIALADASLAGVIVLAGAARPLEEAVLAQSKYMAEADGNITAAEQLSIDQANTLITQVRALTPADVTAATLIFGAPAAYWLDLRGYDPPVVATQVKMPMLILQGERDYQVTMAEFARWKAALSGRTDVTFHSYPALNHLLIAGTGPSLPGEYQVRGHVAEDVVRDMASWITRAAGI